MIGPLCFEKPSFCFVLLSRQSESHICVSSISLHILFRMVSTYCGRVLEYYSRLSLSRLRLSQEQFLPFPTIFSIYISNYLKDSNCILVKFGCAIYIFLNSENLICRSTDISKGFRGSLQLRDNESRLYLLCKITRNFDLVAQSVDFVIRNLDFVFRNFVLVAQSFDLVSRRVEISTLYTVET